MTGTDADALIELAEAENARIRGGEAGAAIADLEGRYGELATVLDRLTASSDAGRALRLATALTSFWMQTKRLEEGRGWFDRALALEGGDARRGRALFSAGYLAFWQGDDERSTAFQEQAVDHARRTDDPSTTALALVGLARIALRSGDTDRARRLCREAIAVTEGVDDRAGRSSAMHVLGVAAQMAGDLEEARTVMSERIALAREEGNEFTIASEAGNLSMVERQLGHLDEAEALALEAFGIVARRGDELAMAWMTNGVAAVERDRGRFERAARLIGLADRWMAASGGAWPPDEIVHYEATVARLGEALGPAPFEEERAAGRALSTREGIQLVVGRPAGGS